MARFAGQPPKGSAFTFFTQTLSLSDGSAADADSAPTYRIYEEETGTPLLTGTMSAVDPSKNLLDEDTSSQLASVGNWVAGGGASSIARVVIADESLPMTGLPSGVRHAVKITADGDAANLITRNTFTVAAAGDYALSAYILAGAPYDGSKLRVQSSNYTSSSLIGDTQLIPSTSAWQRIEERRTVDAGDLSGNLVMFDDPFDGLTNGNIVYMAAIQMEQSTTVTAWEPGGARPGYYTETVTLSTGAGFEQGKSYVIRIQAVIGGTTTAGIQKFTLDTPVANIPFEVPLGATEATSLDGDTQHFLLPARNIMEADNSIAYASVGNWGAASGSSSIERVIIADEGLPSTGLPPGIKTAWKLTANNAAAIYAVRTGQTLTAEIYQTSAYILVGASWDGGDLRVHGEEYTSATLGTTNAITGSETVWKRADRSITPDSGDLVGNMVLRSTSAATSGRIVYMTGFQVAQESNLSDWDRNALFSFGPQDWWYSVWVKPANSTVTVNEWIIGRWTHNTATEWSVLFEQSTDKWWAGKSHNGSTQNYVQHSTLPVAGEWTHLFGYYDQSADTAYLIVNNDVQGSVATTTGVFQNGGTNVQFMLGYALGTGREEFEGDIGPAMVGCAAAGMTETFANTASLLYNEGRGITYDQITDLQIADIGLVEAFDMDEDVIHQGNIVGRHAGVTMENVGVAIPGDASGPFPGALTFADGPFQFVPDGGFQIDFPLDQIGYTDDFSVTRESSVTMPFVDNLLFDPVGTGNGTAFDGLNQYWDLPPVNLVDADDSIAYASVGGWTTSAGATSVTRVLISAEGITSNGLPLGVNTVYKITLNGSALAKADLPVTLTAAGHFGSYYVLAGGTYSGGNVDASEIFLNFASSTNDSTSGDITPNTTTWQRVWSEQTIDSGDLSGDLNVVTTANGSASDVLYFACVQVAQEASLSDWDRNALLSFGDQDCWMAGWFKATNSGTTDYLMSKYRASGNEREWALSVTSGGNYQGRFSADGTATTDFGSEAVGTDEWKFIFLYFDSVGNLAGFSANGETPVTTAHTALFQGTGRFQVCARDTGQDLAEASVTALAFGCAGAGMTDAFTDIISTLYNDGCGRSYDHLTSGQKSSIGLVVAWDMHSSHGDRHSGVEMTPVNGTFLGLERGPCEDNWEFAFPPSKHTSFDFTIDAAGMTYTESFARTDGSPGILTGVPYAGPDKEDIIIVTVFLDTGTERYAGKYIRHPLWNYEGRVMSAGSVSRELPVPSGPPIISDGAITLADTDNAIRNLLHSQTPQRRLIRLQMGPEDGSLSLFGTPYYGELKQPTASHGKTTLPFRDVTFNWLNDDIPILGTKENFPNTAESNFFVPIIMGTVDSEDDQSTLGAIRLGLLDTTLNSYVVARHPVDSVVLYGKVVSEDVYTLIPASGYTVVEEDTVIGDITYTMTFVRFPSARPDGYTVRADVVGMNSRPAWGQLPAVTDVTTNAIDLIINTLVFIQQIETDITKFNQTKFADTHALFETLGYVCDGAMVEPTSYNAFLGQLGNSFNIDFYQSKDARIAVTMSAAPVTTVATLDDILKLKLGTVEQFWPDPSYNRINYNYTKHYAENEFLAQDEYNNTADQIALAVGAETEKIYAETVDMPWVRDPATANSVIAERATWTDLQAYRVECEVPAPLVQYDIDLADYVNLTHYAGLPEGGWSNAVFRVVGIDFDITQKIYKLTLMKRIAAPAEPVGPITLIGRGATNSRVGPWLGAGNGQFYGVFKPTVPTTNQKRLAVVYSSDWGATWDEQDAAGFIDLTNNIDSFDSHDAGDIIIVATQEATTNRVAYHEFNKTSNTWTVQNEEVVASTTGDTAVVSITERDTVGREKVIGYITDPASGFRRTGVRVRSSGGTWGSEWLPNTDALPIATWPGGYHVTLNRIFAGEGGRYHVLAQIGLGNFQGDWFTIQTRRANDTFSTTYRYWTDSFINFDAPRDVGVYGVFDRGSGREFTWPQKSGWGAPYWYTFIDSDSVTAYNTSVISESIFEVVTEGSPFEGYTAGSIHYVDGKFHYVGSDWTSVGSGGYVVYKTSDEGFPGSSWLPNTGLETKISAQYSFGSLQMAHSNPFIYAGEVWLPVFRNFGNTYSFYLLNTNRDIPWDET